MITSWRCWLCFKQSLLPSKTMICIFQENHMLASTFLSWRFVSIDTSLMLSQLTGSQTSEGSWLATVLPTGNMTATLPISTWATTMVSLVILCLITSLQTIVTSLTLIHLTHPTSLPHAWKSTRSSNLKWLLSMSMMYSASAIRVQVDH
jgi:hypothetical protein